MNKELLKLMRKRHKIHSQLKRSPKDKNILSYIKDSETEPLTRVHVQGQHEVKLLSLAAFCEKMCGIILCGSKMPSFLHVYTHYQLMY